jgi:hypothetical protein
MPAVSPLEKLLVFPGSSSQGQSESRVQPPNACVLVNMHGPDGTKIVGLFGGSTASHDTGTRRTLLYFYGNGMCMADSLNVFNRFRGLGFNAMVVDYEGYGMSAGSPSERGCYAAADAAYDYLLTREDIDQHHIVGVGWSLGAAVAIDLASRKPLTAVATFSAFTSIGELSRTLAPGLPPGFLASRFDNLAKIGSLSCPLFMAHGTSDQLVPPEMLDRLASAAKSKVTVLHVSGAAHNDIFFVGGDSLYHKLQTFVNGLPPSPATHRD